MMIRKAFRFLLFALVALFLSGIVSTAPAQTAERHDWDDSNPCETAVPWPGALAEGWSMLRPDLFPWMIRPVETKGLTPADWGLVVYDSNQDVCWLADANL